MSNHYRTLGISSDATKEEIKKAFQRSALQFHPDKHGKSSPELRDVAGRIFRRAREAYEVLSDDRRRDEYDRGRVPYRHHPAPHCRSAPSA